MKIKEIIIKLSYYIKSIALRKHLAVVICIPVALTAITVAILALSSGDRAKQSDDSSDMDPTGTSAAEALETDLPPNCLEYQSLGNGTCIVMGLGSFEGSELYIPDTSPFGDEVIGIGNRAFERCTSLVSVSIPKTVTSIGSEAFRGCSSLVLISVDSANTNYRAVSGVLYSKDKTVLICCPPARIGSNFLLDVNVRIIESYAFEGNRNITQILYEHGTADFEGISVGEGNEEFLSLPITCNYVPGK